MMRRAVVTAVVLAVTGAATGQAVFAARSTVWPKPKVGAWKLTQSFNETHSGTFTVTSALNEKSLQTRVGSAAVQYCGTGLVQVLGRHPIHLVGQGNNRAYIVGKRLNPSGSYGVAPIKVTVLFKKTRWPGTLVMKFEGATTGEGQVNFNPIQGYACDLAFSFHKAK